MSSSDSQEPRDSEPNDTATLPVIEKLLPKVDAKLDQRDWPTAKSMLDEMEEHYGEHPEILKRYGIIQSWCGELEDALDTFEQAKDLGGNGDELGQLAWLSLANSSNTPEVFEAVFPRLRKIGSKESFAAALGAVIERAINEGNWPDAEKWCERGVKWLPDSPAVLHYGLELMLQTHRLEAAAGIAERLSKIEPGVQEVAVYLRQHAQLQQTLGEKRPVEQLVDIEDDRLYFSFPGGPKEFFYALPVLRQILRAKGQEAGVLIAGPSCVPLKELIEAQPYIAEFLVDTATPYLNHVGIQPYTVLPDRPNCFNLGFRPYLMHAQSTGYSETLAILFKIPFIDREEEHLPNTLKPEHGFGDERYVAVCPEPLAPGVPSDAFWQQVVARVTERMPVVLVGPEGIAPSAAQWTSEKIENRIGQLNLAEMAGLLKGASCFFGASTTTYHIARNAGTRPFVFCDPSLPPQAVLAADEIFSSQQLPEVLVHFMQMP